MHVFQRWLAAALMTAGLAAAATPGARASALSDPSWTLARGRLLPEPAPASASASASGATPIEDATLLLGLLRAATHALTDVVGSPGAAHPGTTGSAGAPAAPVRAGVHRDYCHGCVEMSAPGRVSLLELPARLLASGPAFAGMVLPDGAVLFLAGALVGALAGLALSSMVVGIDGPDVEQARNQGEMRQA